MEILVGLYDVPKQQRIHLTSNIIHNAPNVICRGTDTLTDRQTHIYSRFRDKLSLLRSLVFVILSIRRITCTGNHKYLWFATGRRKCSYCHLLVRNPYVSIRPKRQERAFPLAFLSYFGLVQSTNSLIHNAPKNDILG